MKRGLVGDLLASTVPQLSTRLFGDAAWVMPGVSCWVNCVDVQNVDNNEVIHAPQWMLGQVERADNVQKRNRKVCVIPDSHTAQHRRQNPRILDFENIQLMVRPIVLGEESSHLSAAPASKKTRCLCSRVLPSREGHRIGCGFLFSPDNSAREEASHKERGRERGRLRT